MLSIIDVKGLQRSRISCWLAFSFVVLASLRYHGGSKPGKCHSRRKALARGKCVSAGRAAEPTGKRR